MIGSDRRLVEPERGTEQVDGLANPPRVQIIRTKLLRLAIACEALCPSFASSALSVASSSLIASLVRPAA